MNLNKNFGNIIFNKNTLDFYNFNNKQLTFTMKQLLDEYTKQINEYEIEHYCLTGDFVLKFIKTKKNAQFRIFR